MRIVPTLLFSLGIAGATCASAPPVYADRLLFASDDIKRAEVLHQQGKALMKERKYAEALETYIAAYKLNETFPIAANIGQLEVLLGHPREAAEHLARALRLHAKEAKPEAVAALQSNFELAKQDIGALRVHVTPADADVKVDGRWFGWTEHDDDLFVEPGMHVVEASQKGYLSTQQTITIGKGEHLEVRLTLVPVARPSAAAPLPEMPMRQSNSGKSLPLLITGTGLALTGLALGTSFTVVANGQLSDALVLRDDLVRGAGQQACAAPTGSVATDCGRLREALTAASRLSNAAVWSFLGAGALTLTTATYALWPRADSGKKGASVTLRFAPLPSGITMAGTF